MPLPTPGRVEPRFRNAAYLIAACLCLSLFAFFLCNVVRIVRNGRHPPTTSSELTEWGRMPIVALCSATCESAASNVTFGFGQLKLDADFDRPLNGYIVEATGDKARASEVPFDVTSFPTALGELRCFEFNLTSLTPVFEGDWSTTMDLKVSYLVATNPQAQDTSLNLGLVLRDGAEDGNLETKGVLESYAMDAAAGVVNSIELEKNLHRRYILFSNFEYNLFHPKDSITFNTVVQAPFTRLRPTLPAKPLSNVGVVPWANETDVGRLHFAGHYMLVCNGAPRGVQNRSLGLGLRRTKLVEDVSNYRVHCDSSLEGIDETDGWLRTQRDERVLYLPMSVDSDDGTRLRVFPCQARVVALQLGVTKETVTLVARKSAGVCIMELVSQIGGYVAVIGTLFGLCFVQKNTHISHVQAYNEMTAVWGKPGLDFFRNEEDCYGVETVSLKSEDSASIP